MLGGNLPKQKLLVKDLMKTEERTRDLDKIRQVILAHNIQDVMRTPISWSHQGDQLIWPYNKQGMYAVNSGYSVAKVL